MAGLKDRRAVTRQWVSVPAMSVPAVGRIEEERVQVLDQRLHKNKLRTGHLLGNRFGIVVREVVELAKERIEAKLSCLEESGMANFYGAQRMGRGGSTLAAGWALSQGMSRLVLLRMPDDCVHQLNLRDRNLRRLAASALQSELFNRVLAHRLERGIHRTVLPGDVCKKTDTGGLFVTDDPDREQRRLERGEVVVTGPMWGPKMKRPQAAALEIETKMLAEMGLEEADFGRLGNLAAGTRRPLVVPVSTPSVVSCEDGVAVEFGLPAGSYATVLVHELVGPLDAADQVAKGRAEDVESTHRGEVTSTKEGQGSCG
jgi:tRNA pseudouridine13 synthase